LRDRIKARQQVRQRGLAAAGAAHQRHRLAGPDVQVDSCERQSLRLLVAEAHLLERNLATHPLDGSGAGLLLDWLVDEAKDRVGRRQRPLELAVHVGKMLERREDHQHGGDERDEIADGGLVALRLVECDRDHRGHGYRRHDLGDRHDQRRGYRHAPREVAQLAAGRREARALVVLPAVDLHHRVAVDRLLDDAGQLAGVADLLGGQPPHALGERPDRQRNQRDQDQGDRRKLPVEVEQPAEQADDHEGVPHQDDHHARQRLGDVLHVAHQPCDHRAGRSHGEEPDWQLHQPREHLAAQVEQHLLAHVVHRVVHREGESAAQHEEPDDHHRREPHQARIAGLAETVVEEDLHDCREHRLGERRQDHRDDAERKDLPVRLDVPEQATQQDLVGNGRLHR
jgi:hypothetical protein